MYVCGRRERRTYYRVEGVVCELADLRCVSLGRTCDLAEAVTVRCGMGYVRPWWRWVLDRKTGELQVGAGERCSWRSSWRVSKVVFWWLLGAKLRCRVLVNLDGLGEHQPQCM